MGEMGNRDEQIFVNAIASKYKYVDDIEITVCPQKLPTEENGQEVDGETGIAYQTTCKLKISIFFILFAKKIRNLRAFEFLKLLNKNIFMGIRFSLI